MWLDQALPDAWKLAKKLLDRQDGGNWFGEDTLELLLVKYACWVASHLLLGSVLQARSNRTCQLH